MSPYTFQRIVDLFLIGFTYNVVMVNGQYFLRVASPRPNDYHVPVMVDIHLKDSNARMFYYSVRHVTRMYS